MRENRSSSGELIPVEVVERKIRLVCGQKIMLDSDLAALYQVPTKLLNLAVRRNSGRFPADFVFQLTREETSALRFQFETSKKGRGGPRYRPYAFTEHRVAMLSSVLGSRRAVQMNILIIRAFVRLRELLATHKDLAAHIEKLEAARSRHASVISILAEEIKNLKPLPPGRRRRSIGFTPEPEESF